MKIVVRAKRIYMILGMIVMVLAVAGIVAISIFVKPMVIKVILIVLCTILLLIAMAGIVRFVNSRMEIDGDDIEYISFLRKHYTYKLKDLRIHVIRRKNGKKSIPGCVIISKDNKKIIIPEMYNNYGRLIDYIYRNAHGITVTKTLW